jgi:hypothetical protein
MGHFDGRRGAAQAQFARGSLLDVIGSSGLLFFGSGLAGAGIFEQLEFAARFVEGAEASGAEKDDGVLDALAAKASERFRVFREDAENAAIRTVQVGFVLIGQRGPFQRVRQLAGHFQLSL